MAALSRAIVIALSFCGSVLTVPTNPRDLSPTLPYQSAQVSHPLQKQSRPWTRVRDAIIHKIWGPAPSLNYQPLRGRRQYSTTTTTTTKSNFRANYGDDVVLRFRFKTAEEARALADAADTLYLDVWEFGKDWVDIRLARDVVEPLIGLLPSSLHNAHAPLMHDLAQAIFESYPAGSINKQSSIPFRDHQGSTAFLNHGISSDGTELFFNDYQPLSVITPWMRLLASLFPTLVQMVNVGISYEGRDIPALRIGLRQGDKPDASKPRRTIIISGGSHAREWISTASTNYVAYSLITGYDKLPFVTKLIDDFDWIIIPTLNPDGYVYSWDHDRLWRKNRQQTSIPFCPGIDLDRAYGYEWDGDLTRTNPCSESYAGDGPFDGVEAHRFALWARNETEHNNVKFAAFLDLHSYSQEILYPYSFSCDQHPPTLENLEELAMGLAKAIRLTHNHGYEVTSACKGYTGASSRSVEDLWPRMELSGGSALDWFYHELNVKYAYQIKLRDTGSYGFLLPSSDILPTGQEIFNAVLDLGSFLLGNKGIEGSVDAGSERASTLQPETRGERSQTQRGVEEHQLPREIANEYDNGDASGTELRRKRRR